MPSHKDRIRRNYDKIKDTIICQFCERESSSSSWVDDKCPICKKKYNWMLAQDSEE